MLEKPSDLIDPNSPAVWYFKDILINAKYAVVEPYEEVKSDIIFVIDSTSWLQLSHFQQVVKMNKNSCFVS